jgi:hypothetical protein
MRWRDSWYTDEFGTPLSTIFTYDQRARLIREAWIRATSEESYDWTYEYRDDDRVLQHAYHYAGDISDFYDQHGVEHHAELVDVATHAGRLAEDLERAHLAHNRGESSVGS